MFRFRSINSSTFVAATTAACVGLAWAAPAPGAAPGDVIEFQITIDGDQEVPPVDTPATGFGTATLDTSTNELSWFIEFSGLLAPETAAHFHGEAPLCANAGIVIGLGTGSPKVGSQVLTPAQVDAVTQGLWYVNIHSTMFPAGEIRGQVMPAPLLDALPPVDQGSVHVELQTIASDMVAPNWGTTAPGDADRLFITDQEGTLWVIDLDTNDKSVFLDTSDVIVPVGAFGPGSFDERGLLGIAFHPDYQSNGLLYTYTSEPVDGEADFSTMPGGETANHQSLVREWTVPDPGDPNSLPDPESRVLLRVDQPQFNHNGGGLEFGPDGMLYISIGDGGGADDQGVGHPCIGNGQDTTNPLGALLRIDPLGSNSANGEYGIPMDNPFVGMGGFVDEIFAYGLRNPWRFAFDQGTGDLWLADVGQNDIEEINIIAAGGNYGWPHKEGTFFFVNNGHESGYITDMPLAPAAGVSGPFIDPVAEYHNPTDGIAIIGGFVYRGDRIPALQGRYVFGDWSMSFATPGGRLFFLDENDEIRELILIDQEELGLFINGFGQDAAGEIYVLGNTTGTPFGKTGVVLKIAPKLGDLDADGVVGVDDLLILLADWGPCSDPANCPADLTGDGNVGVDDLLLLLANWG